MDPDTISPIPAAVVGERFSKKHRFDAAPVRAFAMASGDMERSLRDGAGQHCVAAFDDMPPS
jgi:hypothetical protein